MSSIGAALLECLRSVERSGDFCVGGRREIFMPAIGESGSAEHTGYYRHRRWTEDEEDDEEFEVVEVFDRSLLLSEWRRPDGTAASFSDFPFTEDELCPPDAFDDLTPDEQHFHEATGNEGASFERTYRRAGLVLWPRARRLAVLNQAGLCATLPHLEDLTAAPSRRCGARPTSFRGTCCARGPASHGERRAMSTPAGCSTCRSGWPTRRASMRFSPTCQLKATTRRPTTRRSCVPPRFLRDRVPRSC
jgi:hypothetical protein